MKLPSPSTPRPRLLMVSQWFDPEPTFKGLMFAKALRARGFDVQVITGFPNYPGGRVYYGYKIRAVQRESIDGIDIIRVPLFPSHDSSGARRAMNYLSFAASASIAALLVKRPDVAYIYHPPATVGFVAHILKLLRGVPFVYDVQDLWPDTLAATGMLNNKTVLAGIGCFMGSVYRSAARVAVLSPGFRRELENRGVPVEKVEVIPNWTYEPPRGKRQISPPKSGDFVVLYAGNVGTAQSLDVILRAAKILQGSAVRFDIIGDGTELNELRMKALGEGLDNVHFLPRRSAFEMDEILESANVLLVHLRDDPLFRITIPSKIQAYLRAGKPILIGVGGDASALVKEARAGVSFSPESAEDLVRAVEELRTLSSSDRIGLGETGRKFYEERLSLDVGSDHFVRVLKAASYMRPRYLQAKRCFDVLASGLGLIACAIPMVVVACLVRSRIGSPVLFVQQRPGRDDVSFEMYKFRTMTNETDPNGSLLPDHARLTHLGRMLRATSLDELPELWNVLKGDMSMVGPRPLLSRYTPFFHTSERLRLSVRPGITGWAQVNGRNTVGWDERLAHDVWYVENQSIWLDTRIVLQTVLRVLKSDGVVIDPESIMKNLDVERSGDNST